MGEWVNGRVGEGSACAAPIPPLSHSVFSLIRDLPTHKGDSILKITKLTNRLHIPLDSTLGASVFKMPLYTF
jgi:hypothetical protein